jgi:DNA repair exonuclease SbcCD ATPase subunit
MSYRPQTSSRRSTGRGRGELRHEKAKRKGQKHRSGGKYLLEESEAPTFEEEVEKTLGRLQSLGGQIFAFSPFNQYYDDWLLSLKSVLSEFESNPAVNVDEEFVKERSQVIADVELKLAERRREEAVLEETTRRLADQNHLLVQIDTEYAHTTHQLASKRNSEIKRLTRRVHDFEEELEEASRMKASILSPFARRAKSHRIAEATRKLDAAKSELESVMKAFEAEQEKLHDDYEKRKQAVIEQVRNLEKEIEGLDTDGSVEIRRVACEDLISAVEALLQRKTASTN